MSGNQKCETGAGCFVLFERYFENTHENSILAKQFACLGITETFSLKEIVIQAYLLYVSLLQSGGSCEHQRVQTLV